MPSQEPVGGPISRKKWRRWYTAVLVLFLVALLELAARPGGVVGKMRSGEPADELQGARRGLQLWRGTNSRRETAAPLQFSGGQRRRREQGWEIAEPSQDAGGFDNSRKGAGGEFGLSADWREAIQEKNGSAVGGGGGDSGGDSGWGGLRGEACMTSAKREEVREVLEKRRLTPHRKKVAVCLRTKDYARFLPEWLAFHFAVGVDEVSIYDDDSADNTTAVLQPFVEAGFVRYVFEVIGGLSHEMDPLNHCLRYYQEQKKNGASNAPTYLLFHDTDEYIFPVNTNLTILHALEQHHDICCTLVHRIQFGSSGFHDMPRGLMIEKFLLHQPLASHKANPKVMVNLEPTESEDVFHLKSMHNAEGCQCLLTHWGDIRINHYLGSHGDYVERLSRYWPQVLRSSESRDAEHRFTKRDQNDERSDVITHWACATREILFRAVQGLNLETGLTRESEGDAPNLAKDDR